VTPDTGEAGAESFVDREELGIPSLWEQFGVPGEPQLEAFAECLALIAQECHLAIGRLRPHDSLESVMGKPQTRNPLSWVFDRASFEDRSSELSFRLKQRRKGLGARPMPDRTLASVRDYVLAWLHREA
jgi:hypothetical protein